MNDSIFIGIDISKDETEACLIVGRMNNNKIDVINAFSGQDAIDLYKKLTEVKK